MYLNPTLEYNHIREWISTLVNDQSLTPKILVKKLKKHLNQFHPIKVTLRRATNDLLDPDEFSFGAEYDPTRDEQQKKQFLLDVYINHSKNKSWVITQQVADRIAIELVEVLVHEYEHQRHYRQRIYLMNKEYYSSDHPQKKTKDRQEYLGNPDEINAYALNIAARYYLLKHKIKNGPRARSLDLQAYFEVFGRNHPVTKQLLKKIKENIKYFKENDNGKRHKKSYKRYRIKRV